MWQKKLEENTPVSMEIFGEDEENFTPSIKHQTYFSKYKIWIAGAVILIVTFLLMFNFTCKRKGGYTKQKMFYPTLELPINFVWIGQQPLPQKYVERLKMIKFPYKLLGEKEYDEFKNMFNFSADISIGKRSDAFKLAYIWKYGGIYSDFDYVINYQCLMMKLQGLQGTYYSKQQDQHRMPAISLFYSSKPGDPILQEVLKVANQRQKQRTIHFLFGYMQKKYENQLKSVDLDSCAYHEFDGSWIASDPNPW